MASVADPRIALPAVPGAGLPMVVQPHPFRLARVDALAPAGSTIAQAVAAAGLPPFMAAYVRVWVDDWEVPRHLWATARPKPGRIVFIKVYPHGGGRRGGKNPLATVLSLAVMIAAPYMATAMLGAEVAASTAFTVFGEAVTFGRLAGMAFSMVANMAINALVGTPAPAQEANNFNPGQATAPTYSITGTSNRFAPYANIPRVLGRKGKHYPLMAARPYTESQGNDRYVRLLLLAGYGPLSISDICIGETPIAAFDGVEIEINEGGPPGWAGNKDITLYTQAIREDQLSVTLTSAGGWQLRQTRDATAEISLDISFPRGLITYQSDGTRSARSVTLEVQYRKVGDTTWLTPTWANPDDPGMGVDGEITATEATQSSAVRAARWYTGAAAAYEVQVRRTTGDGGDRVVDTSVWSALRSIQTETPVRQQQVCTIAIRIKASEQLNGVPDSINCTAEAWHPVWSGSAWSWQKTRNPAWESLDLLRRRGPDTLMADSRLDLDGYLAFATACDATPPNGPAPYWTYDAVLNGGSVWSAVRDVLAHGRATRTMRDGRHSVVMDAEQTVPVQHISPRNSWKYSGAKKFIDLPHALHVKFINSERGFVEDVCTVYADGYDETTATRFESVEYFGCTRSDQAWRIGRYLHAVGKLRPEDHSIYLDIESLRCTLGDLVRFSHDVILVGTGHGRLDAVTTSDGNITALGLDSPVEMATGVSYAVRCRRSDGSSVLMGVNTVFGVQDTLTLTTPIATALGPAVGDLFQFGESGLESMPCIVKKIERGPDLTAKLTLVDAAPGVWSADQGAIPPFSSWITSGVTPRNQAPAAPTLVLRSDATAILRLADGTLQDRIAVTLAPPAASAVAYASYEIRWRETGAAAWGAIQPVPDAASTGWIAPVVMGAAYDVQARAISTFGVVGEWAQTDAHVVVGKSAPPAAMPWATLSDGILRWGDTGELDLAGAIWRWQPGGNESWGDANPLHDGLVQSPYTLANRPLGQVTLLGKWVDVVGNESAAAVAIVTDFGDPLVANVIYDKDCHADGFTGTRTNATVDGGTGDLMATADGSPVMWTDDAAAFWTADSDPMWATTTYKAMSYEDSLAVAAGDAGSQLTVASTIAAGSFEIDYRRDGAAPMWSDDLAPLWTSDTDPMWIDEAWQSWPGAIAAEAMTYLFRVATSAGATRGRISALDLRLDVPDLQETLANVALASGGTRLALTRSYRAIKTVNLTLQADGGAARSLEVIDKDAALGPMCRGFDSTHTGTSAHADAIVQGY